MRTRNNVRLAANLLAICTMLVTMSAAWVATLVVANKSDATASLLDLESGEVVATLTTGDGPHEVGISPDGRYALVANYGGRGSSNNSLTLIDIAKAEAVKTIDLGEYKAPHGVEWIDDNHAAVTVEANQALAVVDVAKGEVKQAIATGQRVSHMVALDPDGQRAYTSNMGSGTITVLDLGAGKRLWNIATGKGAEGIAVSTAGHVWVTNREDDTLTVLDGESLKTIKEITSVGFPIRAAATPKGQVLVTRARAGDLVVYDGETFEEVRTVPFDLKSLGSDGRLFRDRFGDSSVPIGVVVDGAGERAFVAHANADVITEVDLNSGEILRTLRAGREPDGMGFSAISIKH